MKACRTRSTPSFDQLSLPGERNFHITSVSRLLSPTPKVLLMRWTRNILITKFTFDNKVKFCVPRNGVPCNVRWSLQWSCRTSPITTIAMRAQLLLVKLHSRLRGISIVENVFLPELQALKFGAFFFKEVCYTVPTNWSSILYFPLFTEFYSWLIFKPQVNIHNCFGIPMYSPLSYSSIVTANSLTHLTCLTNLTL